MRHLNGWRLLGLLVASALAVGCLYVGHEFQVNRAAPKLRLRAERFKAEKNLPRAHVFYKRYLTFRPNDLDALGRFGLISRDLARTREEQIKAFLILEQVLRADASLSKFRWDAVRLAVAIDRLPDAKIHASVLLKEEPGNAELELILGQCEERENHLAKAAEFYELSIKHQPTNLDAYVRLAVLLRTRMNHPSEGDEVMNRLVKTMSDSSDASFKRALYRRQFGLAGAADDISRVVKLLPEDENVILLAADIANSAKKTDEARTLLERGIKLHPKSSRMYQFLVDLETNQNHLEAAEKVVRVGLDQLPDDDDLKWLLADIQIDQEKFDEVAATAKELRDRGYQNEFVGFLEACVLFGRQQWAASARAFEALRPQATNFPRLVRRGDQFLGLCYRRLGDTDKQVATYRRMLESSSSGQELKMALAGTLVDLGRIDQAITVYQQVSSAIPLAKVALARLLLIQALRKPASRRDLDSVNKAIEEAARAMPDSDLVPSLKAQVLLAQDKPKEALDHVRAARDSNRKSLNLWLGLLSTAEKSGQNAQIPGILDQAEQQFGDHVKIRLFRARHLVLTRPTGVVESLVKLSEGWERFSLEDQQSLIRGIADGLVSVGDDASAMKLWSTWLEKNPKELDGFLAMFDLAIATGDEAIQMKTLEQIRKIDGEEGILWRLGDARRLLARGRKGDASAYGEATSRIAEIRKVRSSWSRVTLLEAEIDDASGHPDRALPNYLRAIEMGMRDPFSLRRTLQLLYNSRRYDDANIVLSMLQDLAIVSNEVQKQAVELLVKSRDFERAVELARKAVSSQSSDFRDHLWLGQVLWSIGKVDEAKGPLKTAKVLAGDDPSARISLVQFLVSTDQIAEAEAEVAEAERTLPPSEILALAQCYDLISQRDRSKKLFEKALAASPNDPAVLRACALRFIREGQAKDAAALLLRLTENKANTPETTAWARRTLATLLAGSGDPTQTTRALTLLGLSDERSRITPDLDAASDEIRSKADVLARQGLSSERRHAIRLFEELLRRGDATDPDQFLLAQLEELEGDWGRAEPRMRALCGKACREPVFLVRYIRALMRHDASSQAEPYLATLEALEPRSLDAAQLKALLLKERGEASLAVAMLQDLARKEPNQLPPIAAIYEQIGEYPSAEALFRQFAGGESLSQPINALELAGFLGRRGRTKEAIDICERIQSKCAPDMLTSILIEIVSAPNAEPAQFPRVEAWLRQGLSKDTDTRLYAVALATLSNAQGNPREAEARYREVLSKDPRNLVSLNNLAFLLSFQEGKGEEALGLVKRAIDVAGMLPVLLDTRAVILASMGRSKEALQDLERAIASEPQPSMYYHLAQLYDRLGEEENARMSLRRGDQIGLDPTKVEPLERSKYAALLARLVPRR